MLDITHEHTATGRTVCCPHGDLDAFTVDQFRQALSELVSPNGLIIDLSATTFIDSAGLGALIGAIRRIRELGGDVALACSRPTLTRLLHSTGFGHIVPIAPGVDEAESTLQAHQPMDSRQSTKATPMGSYPTTAKANVRARSNEANAKSALLVRSDPTVNPNSTRELAANHAMGVELQIEELVEQRKRAAAQHRPEEAERIVEEIRDLQEELAQTSEIARAVSSNVDGRDEEPDHGHVEV